MFGTSYPKKCNPNLKSIVDMVHGLGCLVPEGDQGVLVHDQCVGEHVTPRENSVSL